MTFRPHGLPKVKFIAGFESYLDARRKIKNHFVIGDFSIYIFENDRFGQEHLNYCIVRPRLSVYNKAI